LDFSQGTACTDDQITGTDSNSLFKIEQQDSTFSKVYQDHYSAIAEYLYRRTGQVAIAEDLAGDAFLAAFRSYHQFQDRGIPIRHWLYRIATHEANRWARRQKRQSFVQLKNTETIEATNVQNSRGGEIEEALTALHSLSPKHQTVLTLHYLEELDLKEIAKLLGCRLGTIKSRISRARDSLRKHLSRTKSK